MSCEDYFIQQLHDRGFRLTPQREMVLSVLHEMEGLVTAEEIYEHVRARSASTDVSTVYRTLDLLEELELVAVLSTGDDQRRYELLGIHGLHHHLRCTNCGKIVPVDPEELAPLLAHLQEAYGFAAHLGSLTLPGLCATCRAAEAQGTAEAG